MATTVLSPESEGGKETLLVGRACGAVMCRLRCSPHTCQPSKLCHGARGRLRRGCCGPELSSLILLYLMRRDSELRNCDLNLVF